MVLLGVGNPPLEQYQNVIATWHRTRWADRTGMRERIMLKLVSEVGELADALSLPSSQLSGEQRGSVEQEAADVLTCLLALADEEGFDLAAAWRVKFSEVQAR